MKTAPPFLVFPWEQPFLPALKARIMADTGGKPGNALVIVPNERPWQYFRQIFESEGRAVILPRMITGRTVAAVWRRHCCGPAAQATLLDQVCYIHRCVRALGERDSLLRSVFGRMEMSRFLPWGIRLAQLMDEIFQQHISAPDIAVPEGDLHRYAIALLGSLASISSSWRALLLERRLTTPGFDAWLACENVNTIPPELSPERRPVYIAGFSVLSGSEELLFRTLREHGAYMCFQGDAALATGGHVPGPCKPISNLMQKWRAPGDLACESVATAPEYTFCSAYDGHSQLEKLVADRQRETEGTTAIVLLNAELLGPVLHHLEDKNVNISMGFPLARAPLCGLLRTIFKLLLNRLEDGRYYWRDLDLVLHHPLTGMLRHGEEETFRQKALPLLHKVLRGGEKGAEMGKYVYLDDVLTVVKAQLPSWCLVALKLGYLFLEELAQARTPARMAALLGIFCTYMGRKALLLPRDGKAGGERHFPLDTEALCRLQDSIFPALGRNALAEEEFSLTTLRDMLRVLVEQERIPFKAFPLLGTQVLGMLETRLLHFNHVYILDASDDLLPGGTTPDPLLPDNLRGIIGLPQRTSRQQVSAYNLARLCAGASTVHFYWTQGQAPGSMDQGKKSRSRFVEQLLWNLEKKDGKLLKLGEGPLRGVASRAVIHRGKARSIPCQDALRAKLQTLLSGCLSASMLNTYISCPVRFAYKYLLNLNVPLEVNEGEDPLIVGECVHAVLRDLYEPLLDRGVPADEEGRRSYLDAHLDEIFGKRTKEYKLESKLPVFSWLYFEKASPRRIAAYFLEQPTDSIPIHLEKDARSRILLGLDAYVFHGRMDRVDIRNGELVILDYKTGSPKSCDTEFWNDAEFFQTLDECVSGADFAMRGDNLLDALRERLPDVQLPVYLLLAASDIGGGAANAAYVWLRNSGGNQEAFLWPDNMDRNIGLARCASVVAFVVRHLQSCQTFAPRPGKCDYCDYRQACWMDDESRRELEMLPLTVDKK